MNKKLLATAIGAALAAGPMLAAQADVKVYGAAQAEYGDVSVEFDPILGIPDVDVTVIEDNARGRFGVVATEDLGGGLTGLARFEWRVDTADNDRGGNSLTGRESWVGLKGNWGTFKAGNLRSAYKYSGGVTYDPFVTTLLEARSSGGMTGNDLTILGSTGAFGSNNFVANSISYETPNLQGLKIWLTYSPDEAGNTRGDDGDYTASVKYGTKQFEVFAAAAHDAQENVLVGLTEPEYDSVKVGAKFELGEAGKIALQHEIGESNVFDVNLDFLTGAGPALAELDTDLTTTFVGYQLPFGKTTLAVNWAQQEFDTDILGTQDVDYYAIGLIHKFSKQTRVYGGIANTDYDGFVEVETFSVGLRKDF